MPKKISKRMMVVAGLAVIIVGGYIGYGAIFQHRYNSPASTSSTSESITLAGRTVSGTLFCSVEGMYCSGCAYSVQSALTQVEGVESVWVDSRSGTAQVTITEGKSIETSELAKALEGTRYKLTSVKSL